MPRKAVCYLLFASPIWLLLIETREATAGTAETAPAERLIVAPGESVVIEAGEGENLEVAIGGGALTPTDGSVSAPLEEGEYWLAAISRNAAGVASQVRWLVISVDSTAPEVISTFDPLPIEIGDRMWLPPGASVVVGASDRVAGVEEFFVALGEQRRSGTSGEIAWTLPDRQGEASVRTGGRDRVGNTADEDLTVVWIDATAPTIAISVDGPRVDYSGSLVLGPTSALFSTIKDSETGVDAVRHLIDERETNESNWRTGWSAGAHRATVQATDLVGNEGEEALEYTLDSEAPEISWQVGSEQSVENDRGVFHRPPIVLSATATDTPAGVAQIEWSRDGINWSRYSEPMPVDGESLELRAADRVGNRQGAKATWRVDLEPPSLFLVSGNGHRTPVGGTVDAGLGESLRIVTEDSGAGVATTVAAQRQANWYRDVRYTERGSFSFTLPGATYFVYARAEDRLGNRSKGRWTVRVATRGNRP